MKLIHNTYGGGSQTNVNGLLFEKETSLNESLLNAGYNIEENKEIIERQIYNGDAYKKFIQWIEVQEGDTVCMYGLQFDYYK